MRSLHPHKIQPLGKRSLEKIGGGNRGGRTNGGTATVNPPISLRSALARRREGSMGSWDGGNWGKVRLAGFGSILGLGIMLEEAASRSNLFVNMNNLLIIYRYTF